MSEGREKYAGPQPTRTLERWTEREGTTWHEPAQHERETEALSSVKLEVDSKGAIKPTVHVYHADIAVAERLALESLHRIQQAMIDAPIPGLRGATP